MNPLMPQVGPQEFFFSQACLASSHPHSTISWLVYLGLCLQVKTPLL